MTIRAIAGLLALNLGFALSGLALLHALRGFGSWSSVLRLAGLGHVLGMGAFGVLWTELLVIGVPFGGVAVVATLGGFVLGGLVLGRLLDRPFPRPSRPDLRIGLVTAAGLAVVGLFLEALFRAARLQSLQAWDAWSFWVPKGEGIYYFGGLDEHVFTTFTNASYPPLLPILDAAAFHAMGGADVVTLHVQFWFIVLGAVGAIAGCLYRHVPAWLLWPPVVLVLVLPRFGERLLTPQADTLVDVFFVVGALLVALWLRDAAPWRLVTATVLLASAVLTKREGLVFALCVVVGAAAASWGSGRRSWLGLAAAGAAVVAAVVPWRLWYGSHDIATDAPSWPAGDALSRLGDSLALSFDVLASTGLWSVVPIVGAVALVASFVWGDRRLAAYMSAVAMLAFLGGVWSTFGFEELPITADESVNPIVRYTGSIVLLAAAATPLLLTSVWRGAEGRS